MCSSFAYMPAFSKNVKHLGCRHSSVDSSAPTILLPRVWVPRTPFMLFYFIVFVLYLSCEKNGKTKKRPSLVHLKNVKHEILRTHSFIKPVWACTHFKLTLMTRYFVFLQGRNITQACCQEHCSVCVEKYHYPFDWFEFNKTSISATYFTWQSWNCCYYKTEIYGSV